MAFKRTRQTFESDLQKQESPYVFFGTPLPPLDEHTRDDGSFIPIWKQDVTDDRGRKRLHGAFTGGFSAGYYNTVGSKEGWTPSNFVSSRTNRAKDAAKTGQQDLEAFMDEEDLRDAEESRHLQTSNRFSGFGTQDDEKLKGSFMDIFRPPSSTIGMKLLKRMGWKEGQGIGPKVRRAANLDDDALGTPEDQHLFAPEDVSVMSFPQKVDHKGIDYDDEAKLTSTSQRYEKSLKRESHHDEQDQDPFHNIRSTGKTSVLTSGKTKGKSSFGVGILNDNGSDDEDPYSMGPKISYNQVIGGDKKSKKKGASNTSNANPLLKEKPKFVSKKLSTLQDTLRKCHDGRLPLDGFVLVDKLDSFSSMSLSIETYKPPEVPPTWKSSIASDIHETPGGATAAEPSNNRSVFHSAKSRATILGEAPLPGKSVFDFLTPATRKRLVNASGKHDLPPGLSETGLAEEASEGSKNRSLQGFMPDLDQETAKQALNRGAEGFMPYAEDDSKRSRYRAFLEIKAGMRAVNSEGCIPHRADGMSRDDWGIELQEFARAAQVFKPISGLMASRFTSSTSSSPSQHRSQDETGDVSSFLSKPAAKKDDPAEAAAKMGMFGPITRSVINFYPTRLLCKRFNVPLPDHAVSYATTGSSQKDTYTPDLANTDKEHLATSTQARAEPEQLYGLRAVGPITSISNHPGSMAKGSIRSDKTPNSADTSTEIDPEKNTALELPRPSQAIFRAIFGSDDEDEDN